MAKLKYLFFVEYTDGSTFSQTSEDKSIIDPEKRGCFYDVLQSGKTIHKFSIVSTEGESQMITVDLETGIFYHNELPLLLESEKLPTLPEKFNLIWYHQVSQSQNVTFDKTDGHVIKREKLPEFREYFLGWECEINGKKYTQKLGVA